MLLLAMLLGISCVIASACVFNNYIDRDIDAVMARTKKRALVNGHISNRSALTFAATLGLIGAATLLLFTNLLTLLIALAGFFVYVVLYGIWKRRSVHGTVVGSLSGAVPPVVGYCAVTNRFDIGALILFLVLVVWQMPHFYAIAIFRQDDYAAAKVPVLPIVAGAKATKIQMLVYIVAFILAALALTVFGYTGYIYAAAMVLVGLAWLRLSLQGFSAPDNRLWARKHFGFSLIVIMVFSVMISLNVMLV